jgi:hypothetical protein
MRAIAERLILRHPAAAETDYLASSKSKSLALGIEDFKLSLDPYGAVVVDRDFSVWHESCLA